MAEMATKARAFQDFLDAKEIKAFVSETIENDPELTTVFKLANDLNLKDKPFKLYFDGEGSLILDICMITPDEKAEEIGDMVYGMFNVMITFLNENYRTMMKTIW